MLHLTVAAPYRTFTGFHEMLQCLFYIELCDYSIARRPPSGNHREKCIFPLPGMTFSNTRHHTRHILQPPCGQSTPAAHSGLWTGQKLRPWKPRPQGGEKEGICQQDIGRRPSGQLRRIAKQKRICGEKGPVKLL